MATLTRIVILLSLAACTRPAPPARRATSSDITPAACGWTGCSSSLECRDAISSCRYCYLGKCTSVLPADPRDAGIDAALGGTTP